MSDLYDILGLNRDASQADVKKAYRTLAKKYHPDANKDNPKIVDRFKEVSAAYSILGNEEQRRRYDRGEIDETGAEKRAYSNPFGFGGGGRRRASAGFDDFDLDEAQDIFTEFFRSSSRRSGPSRGDNPFEQSGRKRGLDLSYKITIGFDESINGSTRRLTLNDNRNVDIKIPPGIKDGQVIRLSGQGGPAFGKGPKGDALVEIRVAPHPYFTRKDLDIHLELPISLDEAVLGGDIEVPTPKGRLTVRIPKNSSTGKRLRLKGKGVKRGDEVGNMYVNLKLMLPTDRDAELEKLMKQWSGGNGADLRKKAGLY
ncbi:DnaJ C-terminal domain-containing protein [Kordiimonas lacus]|uniref:DnaJ-class molecular chaperone with C-terminal Zn finger domain n=1 Tax=Kordiimonas lacus TaxID=637679 RepID=A0A1G7CFZ7_9PROT|nr:DnaJ C-terminal domain-containing protein [Kordiimonas lacus]SDE38302.1 DnaJ-class molecular chaperone with C-terminal Zn finger domain [Kordiimonas lacus]